MKTPLSDYLAKEEAICVAELLDSLPWTAQRAENVQNRAAQLIEQIRSQKRPAGELESFLHSYSLNTDEGIALMCLAEALLRIPDTQTADALIKDKITAANWGQTKRTADWVVKAAGMGLLLTRGTLESALERIGAPFIREAITKAMRIMGSQFVLGQTIEEAITNAAKFEAQNYRLSYDMLGEGARTAEDAQRYFDSYIHAIKTVPLGGISVKLSALHPRYEIAQADRCIPLLSERLIELCKLASARNLSLTVDAEETDRLELSLKIFENVLQQKSLKEWEKFGLAVQAYQKRARRLIRHLWERSEQYNRRLRVRLVKGAYWDTEIKRAQILGLEDYPVFTRKSNTDLSYLACAHELLSYPKNFKPMLATHNAHTVAAVIHMAQEKKTDFVLQRLHGMGEALFDIVLRDYNIPCSIYAPVGPHSDLLAYLVRRLLENGANSSFVNKLLDKDVDPHTLARDPVEKARANKLKKHPQIPYPSELYKDEQPFGRVNSSGLDLTDPNTLKPLAGKIAAYTLPSAPEPTPSLIIEKALPSSVSHYTTWNAVGAETRAGVLEKIAALYEQNRDELMALLVKEGGKTIADALAEVREAVDFCRYYAGQGRRDFAAAGLSLPGPTGEDNRLLLEGRGAFVCISPWNFPLAIFTGQIAAALMAGNAVVAKPASPTPRIAARAVELMHEAGVPQEILHLIIGGGKIGASLAQHKDVAGIAFTGSTQTAWSINRALAAKDGPIVPLIAETGGQNAMIVDSSALPEQVVDDAILSAFTSAGQRCSALRILCLQEEIADKTIHMLRGAMAELRVGDPAKITTDIGPVIDDNALKSSRAHRKKLDKIATLIAETPLDKTLKGHYFAPCAYEIKSIGDLEGEVFGPILHVVRFKRKNLQILLQQINDTGFGLTCGVHSRIESFHRMVAASVKAGNIYVNRSMIGAVVGSQPFGGQGLSGTGPKAGGPHYLPRFAAEKTISTDTTAAGGNTSLVSMAE